MKKTIIVYELSMAALAFVVVGILFVETTQPLSEEQLRLLSFADFTILVVFACDYGYRLLKAPAKWTFIWNNVFDLVAIIPFDKAFRVARLARLTRLVRLSRTSKVIRVTRLGRIMLLMRKFAATVAGILRTNGLHYVLMTTTILIFLGGYGIYVLEPGMENFGDALWWSMVTTTTVGYGDISPESIGGRILAAILMLVGIGLLGMVTGSIATYFVREKRNSTPDFNAATKALLKEKIDSIETLSDAEVRLVCKMIATLHQSQAAASLDK